MVESLSQEPQRKMGNLDFGNFGTIFQGSEEQLFPSFGTINREAPRAPTARSAAGA